MGNTSDGTYAKPTGAKGSLNPMGSGKSNLGQGPGKRSEHQGSGGAKRNSNPRILMDFATFHAVLLNDSKSYSEL